jgi:hypothetical protein
MVPSFENERPTGVESPGVVHARGGLHVVGRDDAREVAPAGGVIPLGSAVGTPGPGRVKPR